MLIFWSLIFIVSLVRLVKGADWFVESAEKIGLALKISSFIIGVTIVALGTSLLGKIQHQNFLSLLQ